jgi:hypothetical protein
MGYNFVLTKPKKTKAMKTIAKTLVVISILMISLQGIAANQVGFSTAQINYQVQINLPKGMPFDDMNIYVAITNERGMLVAPVQKVHPGLTTYYFSESGPKLGTRTASLIYNPLGTENPPFYSTTDSMTGFFKVGVTYTFNLYIKFIVPGGE